MKRFYVLSLTLACFFACLPAQAAIAIIVNPSNPSELDTRSVRQIFLGQIKTFPDGEKTVTFGNADKDLYSTFVNKVLRRNENTMNAYWARMIFTAKATPPKMLDNDKAVKQAVASDKNAIGYIDVKNVDNSVRVVATVE